jgi:predicted  nucleic acid-binding Zn-ribbon protein
MARGPRKNKSEKLKEALQRVEMEIAKLSEKQKELQAERKQLVEDIQVEQLKELTELMEKSNMSIDELAEMINSASGQEDNSDEAAATMEE